MFDCINDSGLLLSTKPFCLVQVMLIFVHKQLRAKICLIINFSSGCFPPRRTAKKKIEGKLNKQTGKQVFRPFAAKTKWLLIDILSSR